MSPFYNTFVYIPNVPFSVAREVGPSLNVSGLPSKRGLGTRAFDLDTRALGRHDVDAYFEAWTRDMWERAAGAAAGALTLGYVTADACPGAGDDTPHAPVPVLARPPFVWSPLPSGVADADTVDLIFTDFIQNQTLTILDQLVPGKYGAGDVVPYTDSSLTVHEVFLRYAEIAWQQ